MAEERTYIPFTSRAKATTFDGILTEAHQIEDLDYGGAPKNQHDINAEVKANLARIEGIAGSAAAGAYVFKGSLNGLADLLLLKNVKVGDVYNIKTEFTLSGGKYPAGTNVAATKAMSASVPDGWDALGGVTLDLAPITQEIEKLKTGKYDASKVVTTSATNDDAHVLTAKATHDVANSAATTAVNTFKTTNFDPLNQQVSKIDTSKADVTYVNQELQKKSDNGHNHNSQYSAIGHNHTVADISDFSAKVDEKITARVETDASGSTTSDTSFYSCKATKKAIEDYADPISRLANNTFLIFDGVVESATVKLNTTSSITAIKWVKSEGTFAGVGNDGQYYASWVNTKRPCEIYGLLPRNVVYYDKVKGKLCFINEVGSLEEFTDKPLETLINDKAAAKHSHTTAEINGLSGMLGGLAEKDHKHAIAEITGLTTMLAQFVTNTTFKELVDRVEKLEGYLKLA